MNVQISPGSPGGFGPLALSKGLPAKPKRKSKARTQVTRRKAPETVLVDVKQEIEEEEEEDDDKKKEREYILHDPKNIFNKVQCEHSREFKDDDGIRKFRFVAKLLFKETESRHAAQLKAMYCFCYDSGCSNQLLTRVHMCLVCKFVGCFENRHMHNHFDESQHYLSIDVNNGFIYCFGCKDYTFDSDFELITRQIFRHTITVSRYRNVFVPYFYKPTNNEENYFANFCEKAFSITDNGRGLRGLINLGSTCFMNCIIQALVHAPIMRDQFLVDKVESHQCKPMNPRECLFCEMAKIIQAFYSGETTPYIPYQLLHLVWTHAKHLAGYEQQDAHEFFISTLDILHRHSEMIDVQTGRCRCIIDKLFSGKLQSDVVCQACGGVSSVVDPIWDFSLDLVNRTHMENGKPVKEQQPLSLNDCLYLFTRTEHLGSSAKIKCSNCQSYQESTKKLSLKKLPLIASFHLKRFEQTNRSNKKISTYISFPLRLDMTPFTTKKIGARKIHRMEVDGEMNSKNNVIVDNDDKLYVLFAVVNHSGTLETGHYTVFIKHHHQWFKCDDHLVMKATEQEVLRSEGYLLFYHHKNLAYKKVKSPAEK